MKIMSVLIAAMLLAVPLNAKPNKGGGGKGGGTAITGTYAGSTFDSYVVFEVHADGSVTGTIELLGWGPAWPDSYLYEYLLWTSVGGQRSAKGVILDLEYHYDFPEEDVRRLAELFFVADAGELAAKRERAEKWFHEVLEAINDGPFSEDIERAAGRTTGGRDDG